MLASQAEISVWVQAPEAFLRYYPEKKSEIVYATSSAFQPKNGSQCRLQCVRKHFNNRNGVPMRSGSFSTTGTAFPRVLARNDTWLHRFYQFVLSLSHCHQRTYNNQLLLSSQSERFTAVALVGAVAAVFDAVTSQRMRNAFDRRRRTFELVVGTRDETRCSRANERAVCAHATTTNNRYVLSLPHFRGVTEILGGIRKLGKGDIQSMLCLKCSSASEMTYIVSSRALNSTHSLTRLKCSKARLIPKFSQR